MLETSKDLLYVVLSLSILWFTIFLCWLLYQAARILRNANRIVESVTQKLELIVDAVEFIKGKVDHMSGKMTLVNKMVMGLVDKFVISKFTDNLEDRIKTRKAPKKRKTRKKK